MSEFIFGSRNGIHILDLQYTIKYIDKYYDMVVNLVNSGGIILFIGTKRQASEIIAREAQRAGMPYVNHRWLGGTLTNWSTIRNRIDQLKKLEHRRNTGEFNLLTKKEALVLDRQIEKLQLRLGGIRDMKRLPDIVFVVDSNREATAIHECNILNIPVLAIVDSNSDPDKIDYLLPANDDSMRSINLVVSAIADAALEGRSMRKAEAEEVDESLYKYEEYYLLDDDDDEMYLGASTLAKLRNLGGLFDEEDEGIPYIPGPSIKGVIRQETIQHSGSGDIVSGDKAGRDIVKKSDSDHLQEVAFSAYFPNKAHPNIRYGFLVYAHIEAAHDDIMRDVEKFRDELGGTISNPKKAKENARIEQGTRITVVPECDEVEFDPPSLTKRWEDSWSRFGFDFKVSEEDLDQTLFVRVSIQIAGIEIAHIKCAIDVAESDKKKPVTKSLISSNPLADAKLKSKTVTPYQCIFISYSRRDSSVAKSYKIAQTALGNDVFLDVDSLRAGEDWRAALARAIDKADIFQLFWSEHSASSEYCRYEWDYALKVRCPDNTCEGFIRPVYWRKPMPSPPSELSRINFRFVPFDDQDD